MVKFLGTYGVDEISQFRKEIIVRTGDELKKVNNKTITKHKQNF
jgi:hypothetical protein